MELMLWRTACLSLLFSAASLQGERPLDNEKSAQRLWEQMISAKGGRERLLNIHTVLEREVSRYRSQTFKDGKARIDTLYGLPERRWKWFDSRIFGFDLHVSNFKEDLYYFRRYDLTYIDTTPDFGRDLPSMRRIQLVHLNETEWLKPTPIRLLTGKVIPHNVDAIQTMAGGARVDFYLDRRTHLPAAIIDYHPGAIRSTN